MKKIQIGARVSAEDAEFLNLLEIDGARTPSDKLRAIIREARLQREYAQDFPGIYKAIQERVTPLTEKIKKVEFEKNIRSEPLARILEWLPEFYAYCLSSLPEDIDSEEELRLYEQGAVDRVAILYESLLHQELSSHSTSYNQHIFKSHISSLAKIINIIDQSSPTKEG